MLYFQIVGETCVSEPHIKKVLCWGSRIWEMTKSPSNEAYVREVHKLIIRIQQ